MNKLEKVLIINILMLITVGLIVVYYSVNCEKANESEKFLPGVEGVNNVTWGYPEDYYKDGYPVEEKK